MSPHFDVLVNFILFFDVVSMKPLGHSGSLWLLRFTSCTRLENSWDVSGVELRQIFLIMIRNRAKPGPLLLCPLVAPLVFVTSVTRFVKSLLIRALSLRHNSLIIASKRPRLCPVNPSSDKDTSPLVLAIAAAPMRATHKASINPRMQRAPLDIVR